MPALLRARLGATPLISLLARARAHLSVAAQASLVLGVLAVVAGPTVAAVVGLAAAVAVVTRREERDLARDHRQRSRRARTIRVWRIRRSNLDPSARRARRR